MRNPTVTPSMHIPIMHVFGTELCDVEYHLTLILYKSIGNGVNYKRVWEKLEHVHICAFLERKSTLSQGRRLGHSQLLGAH